MKAKLRRWVCPKCGTGCLAPSKPRLDDVRRYCLVCSESTGRLVLRHCPSIDRERERAEKERQEAAERRRKLDEKLSHQWPEVLRLYFEHWCDLDSWPRDERRRVRRTTLRLVCRHSTSGSSGTAWSRRRHIVVRAGTDRAAGLKVLCHEMAHIATPGHGHDRLWRSVFLDACKELCGREVKLPPGRVSRQVLSWKTYMLFRAALDDGRIPILWSDEEPIEGRILRPIVEELAAADDALRVEEKSCV